jgi:peroxiredoxin
VRKILSFIIVLCLTLFVGNAVSLEALPQIGKPAPDFVLNDINGKKVTLAEYKGKVIILNFWATFCGPCKAEMPSLNNLFLSFKKDGLIVLAISTDDSEKPVQSFVKTKGIAFPVLIEKDSQVFSDRYRVLGLPTTFIIDREGIIVGKILGDRPWDAPDMKEKIGTLLSKNRKDGK